MNDTTTTEVKLAEDPAGGDWHFDRRIPIALILAILLNAGAGLWWAASINSRVDVLERALIRSSDDRERLVRVEATVSSIDNRLARMEDRDDR